MITYRPLFALLKALGLRQKDLVEDGTISSGTLQRLRKDTPVSVSILAAICIRLDCTLDAICTIEKDSL